MIGSGPSFSILSTFRTAPLFPNTKKFFYAGDTPLIWRMEEVGKDFYQEYNYFLRVSPDLETEA